MRSIDMPRSHRRGRGVAGVVLCCLASLLAAATRAEDWGLFTTPTAPSVTIFGTYNRGCLEGAEALPLDGDGYQVMRLSRGRYYGHPDLVRFVEALTADLRKAGYSGLLIGDMAQPRGGPMSFGHASHQIGLDVDIWLLPAPDRRLTDDERENLPAPSMVAPDGFGVTTAWGAPQVAALQRAAAAPEVDRIFVNAVIKKELCRTIETDRGWLAKIRPWWGHDAHFHVRLACPPDQYACVPQPPLPPHDGCDAGLDWWFSAAARAELEKQKKAAPKRRLTLADLPAGCLAAFSAE
jgi:penicillin-insensitive murein endopeptidase